MGRWIIKGTRNGETRQWQLEAADESSAKRLAEAKGVQVLQVISETAIVSRNSTAISLPRDVSSPTPQHVVAIPAVERCGNCDAPIGRLETPHVWQDVIVCSACYGKLVGPVSPQIPSPPAQPQPQIIMMQAPTAPHVPTVHVNSSPVVHMHNTNVNTNTLRASRGCLGSLIHSIAVLIGIIIFIVGILAFVLTVMSHK